MEITRVLEKAMGAELAAAVCSYGFSFNSGRDTAGLAAVFENACVKLRKCSSADRITEACSCSSSSLHSRASTSYLAFPELKEYDGNPLYERISNECERLGLGLIVFDDVANVDTFSIEVSARRNNRIGWA